MDRIPENVMINIQSYFKENLPQYEVVKVRKKSWHKDDSYLFMVAAKKIQAYIPPGPVGMI